MEKEKKYSQAKKVSVQSLKGQHHDLSMAWPGVGTGVTNCATGRHSHQTGIPFYEGGLSTQEHFESEQGRNVN